MRRRKLMLVLALALAVVLVLGIAYRIWLNEARRLAAAAAVDCEDVWSRIDSHARAWNPTKPRAEHNCLLMSSQQIEARDAYCRARFVILSYPKAGRTRLKCLLAATAAAAAAPNSVRADPQRVREHLSRVSLDALIDWSTRRFQWIHSPKSEAHPFTLTASQLSAERMRADVGSREMIALLRDPRDVIVSSYYERTRRGQLWNYSYPHDRSLSQFIREPAGSFATLLAAMNIVASIERNTPRGVPPALLLRFENIAPGRQRRCELPSYRRLAYRLSAGNDLPADDVFDAVFERCSFDRMQREADSSQLASLAPATTTAGGSGAAAIAAARKVRRGAIGAYRTELSNFDIEYLEHAMSQALDPALGYRPARQYVGWSID